MREVIAWIIVLLVIGWAIWKEWEARECYDGVKDCGVVWNWDPEEGDDEEDLLERIDFGNKANAQIVTRRIVMITAAALALIMFWYFRRDKFLPPIQDFVVVFVLIMAVVWFAFRYHESHFLFPITERTNFSIDELRERLDL